MSSSVLRQREEISVLESIFKEEEISITAGHDSLAGQFYAFVELETDLKLVINFVKNTDFEREPITQVSYLPPIILHFSLPEDYPSHAKSPPTFTLSCQWLDREQLSVLCQHLDYLWEENVDHDNQEGVEILFIWAQFLKIESFEFLQLVTPNNFLDISAVEEMYIIRSLQSKLSFSDEEGANSMPVDEQKCRPTANKALLSLKNPDWEDVSNTLVPADHPAIDPAEPKVSELESALDCRAIVQFSLKSSVLEFLVEYNKIQVKAAFDRQVQMCNICMDEKLGLLCETFMPCNHVFCKECTNSYLSVTIGDGRIQNITCPATSCSSEAEFHQIKELISPELFAKFDKLLLDATLNSLVDIVNCPRSSCQYPVIRDGEEKLACCYRCQYAFCVECRMGYHGVEPCRMKVAEEQLLVEEYCKGNASQRSLLEKRYSRRRLEMLVENFQTKEWIADNSKNCPQCNAAIHKTFGCNKMVCWRCSTHFCWICSTKLNQELPYLHFMSTTSPCYQLLFQGVDTNDEALNAEILEQLAAENEVAGLDFHAQAQ